MWSLCIVLAALSAILQPAVVFAAGGDALAIGNQGDLATAVPVNTSDTTLHNVTTTTTTTSSNMPLNATQFFGGNSSNMTATAVTAMVSQRRLVWSWNYSDASSSAGVMSLDFAADGGLVAFVNASVCDLGNTTFVVEVFTLKLMGSWQVVNGSALNLTYTNCSATPIDFSSGCSSTFAPEGIVSVMVVRNDTIALNRLLFTVLHIHARKTVNVRDIPDECMLLLEAGNPIFVASGQRIGTSGSGQQLTAASAAPSRTPSPTPPPPTGLVAAISNATLMSRNGFADYPANASVVVNLTLCAGSQRFMLSETARETQDFSVSRVWKGSWIATSPSSLALQLQTCSYSSSGQLPVAAACSAGGQPLMYNITALPHSSDSPQVYTFLDVTNPKPGLAFNYTITAPLNGSCPDSVASDSVVFVTNRGVPLSTRPPSS